MIRPKQTLVWGVSHIVQILSLVMFIISWIGMNITSYYEVNLLNNIFTVAALITGTLCLLSLLVKSLLEAKMSDKFYASVRTYLNEVFDRPKVEITLTDKPATIGSKVKHALLASDTSEVLVVVKDIGDNNE